MAPVNDYKLLEVLATVALPPTQLTTLAAEKLGLCFVATFLIKFNLLGKWTEKSLMLYNLVISNRLDRQDIQRCPILYLPPQSVEARCNLCAAAAM